MSQIAFISGHLNLTEEEFATHYKPKIDEAIARGDSFSIGDARGCDSMAARYIHSLGQVERVTIYHMFLSPRNYVEGAWKRGGYRSDDERDEAMTNHSDYDIAWVREGRETSGTAKNILRRENKIINYPLIIFRIDDGAPFIHIEDGKYKLCYRTWTGSPLLGDESIMRHSYKSLCDARFFAHSVESLLKEHSK